MKTNVTEYDFINAFASFSENYNGQFTRMGLYALYTYITELEEQIGEETELDVIKVCCDWTQYDSAIDAIESLGNNREEVIGSVEISEDKNLDLLEISRREEIEARKWLEDRTTVIDVDRGGIIVLNF